MLFIGLLVLLLFRGALGGCLGLGGGVNTRRLASCGFRNGVALDVGGQGADALFKHVGLDVGQLLGGEAVLEVVIAQAGGDEEVGGHFRFVHVPVLEGGRVGDGDHFAYAALLPSRISIEKVQGAEGGEAEDGLGARGVGAALFTEHARQFRGFEQFFGS